MIEIHFNLTLKNQHFFYLPAHMHSKLLQNESACAWFDNECWYNVFMTLGKSCCRSNPASFSHLTSSWTWVKSDQLELWGVEPTLLRDCYELSRLFNFSIYYLCVSPCTVKLGWDYFLMYFSLSSNFDLRVSCIDRIFLYWVLQW